MLRFNAWDMGGCPRKVCYRLTGAEPAPLDEKSKIVMGMGEALEGLILDSCPYDVTDRGLKMEAQITPRSVFSVKFDGLTHNPPWDEGLWVVEAKALNSRGYYHARRKGFNDSHPQYVMQVAIYANILKANGAVIEYLDRETGSRNREIFNRNLLDKYWQEALEKVVFLEGLIANEMLPDKPANLSSWACLRRYCQYAHLCEYGEGNLKHTAHQHGDPVISLDDRELLDAVTTYAEVQATIKELEAELKAASDFIKKRLQLGQYQVAGYKVSYYEAVRNDIDKKLIPDEVIAKAMRQVKYKVLRVTDSEE